MTPEMKEWIKSISNSFGLIEEYEDEIYGENKTRIEWMKSWEEITLNGEFTIEQLEALIEHMKKYEAKNGK